MSTIIAGIIFTILIIIILICKSFDFIYFVFFFTFCGAILSLIIGFILNFFDDFGKTLMTLSFLMGLALVIVFGCLFVYQELIGSTLGAILKLFRVDEAFGIKFDVSYSKLFWPW